MAITNILESSKSELLNAMADNLRNGLWVTYVDEAGRGSGVISDWFARFTPQIVESPGNPFETSSCEGARDCRRIYPREGMIAYHWCNYVVNFC